MAEIKYNNLYNQLSPMEKRYYDQQFSKNYVPGQENIMLSSQPAYEQMKAAYEAQQEIPESGFFDSIFGSASAAEPPAIPNLSYRNITPTFNLGTGITNTSAATNMYTPFMSNQEMVNRDLVNELIQENQMKANIFSRPNMMNVAGTSLPGGITEVELPYSGVGGMRYKTPRTIADQNRILGQTFTEQKPSGIAKLFEFLGNLPTPFNLARRGLESLQGFNQRLRATDFGQSRTLQEYFEKRAERKAIERARQAAPNVYRDAADRGTLGPGGGFSTTGTPKGETMGDFSGSTKTSRGRQDY